MNGDRDAVADEQLLDGGEILICTFATMDMLRHAVAAELGEDEGAVYGLRPELQLVRSGAGETDGSD
jgi:hypothetical protein